MNRKEQKAKSEAKKVAKKRAQKNPAFAKPTKEELQLINKGINDKKQNIVQAMKSYFMSLETYRQAKEFQKRFDDAIENKVEIKDEYGLPYSRLELESKSRTHFMQLKYLTTDVLELKKDLLITWGIDDKTLEKYYEKWFVGNGAIDYNG